MPLVQHEDGSTTFIPETDLVKVTLGPRVYAGKEHEGHPIADIEIIEELPGGIRQARITRCLTPSYCALCVLLNCSQNPNK